jgi:alkylated DNA repair dioxygenase AlkB
MQNTIKLSDTAWVECGELPQNLKNISFEDIWDLNNNKQDVVIIFGKPTECPRYTQTYMRDYKYSGTQHKAVALPEKLKPYLEWANSLKPNQTYNQVLLNWYKDGTQYIGAHCDDEKEIVKEHPIVSISLGETRTFRIREKETKEIVSDISMKNQTYLIMCGDMQKKYTHEVPKVSGKKGEEMGRRINITFRKFKDE